MTLESGTRVILNNSLFCLTNYLSLAGGWVHNDRFSKLLGCDDLSDPDSCCLMSRGPVGVESFFSGVTGHDDILRLGHLGQVARGSVGIWNYSCRTRT